MTEHDWPAILCRCHAAAQVSVKEFADRLEERAG